MDLFKNGFIQKWIYSKMDLFKNGFIQKWIYSKMDLSKHGFIQTWIYSKMDLFKNGLKIWNNNQIIIIKTFQLCKITKFDWNSYFWNKCFIFYMLQWKSLNVITLGESESDNISQMIIKSDLLLIQSTKLTVLWDLINLGSFDPINQMKTLWVIPLSGFQIQWNYILWSRLMLSFGSYLLSDWPRLRKH